MAITSNYLENLLLPNNYDAATSILVSQFIRDKESRTDFFRNITSQLNPEAVLVSADLSSDTESYEYEHILQVWQV